MERISLAFNEMVYHATTQRALSAIIKDGLRPLSNIGSNYVLYTTDNIDTAQVFASRHTDGVILGFNLHYNDLYRITIGGILLENTINADRIKVLQ